MKPLLYCLTDTHLSLRNLVEVKKVFQTTLNILKKEKKTTLFLLGDLFDSRDAQPLDVLEVFGEILDLYSEKGVQIIAIPGNHDKTDYRSKNSFLDPFQTHPSLCLHKEFTDIGKIGDFHFYLLPFFEDEVYAEEIKKIKINKDSVLLTHIGVDGVKLKGKQITGVPLDFFSNFKKIFTGHYHDKTSYGKFEYVGASLQHNFSEEDDKGLTVIYTDLSYSTIPLNTKKYKTLYTTPLDCLNIDIECGVDTKLVIECTEEDIRSFDKSKLTQKGFVVELKKQKIVDISEIEEGREMFNSSSIFQELSEFCKKEETEFTPISSHLKKIVCLRP